MREFNITDARGGAAFTVRVVPKASKTEIVGLMDDGALKIRLTAPPTDGKANKALIKFLAKVLGVKRDQIEIVAGHSGREKIISVIGIMPAEVDALLGLSPEGKD
jgi:uncharacterized protein (TIGR00251 family)